MTDRTTYLPCGWCGTPVEWLPHEHKIELSTRIDNGRDNVWWLNEIITWCGDPACRAGIQRTHDETAATFVAEHRDEPNNRARYQ